MNRDDLTDKPMDALQDLLNNCNISEYEKLIVSMVNHDADPNERLLYDSLGLAEEAGEVVGKVKKTFRVVDNIDGIHANIPREPILKELGDVLFYMVRLINAMGSNLDEVAAMNLYKIIDRRTRGVLIGEGDDR